jgi:hypothetical protein
MDFRKAQVPETVKMTVQPIPSVSQAAEKDNGSRMISAELSPPTIPTHR